MDTEPASVVKSVVAKEYATRLLNHERNELVINTNGAYYHLDKQKRPVLLSGLLPRLRITYWPENSIYRQMAGVKKPRRSKNGRFGGVVRGTEVHKQLRDFVVLDKKNYRKNHKRLHPYCQRILTTIVSRMHWQPFLPEFSIYDESLRIGTSVDMICLNEEGKLILLEFKTGYKDYFENDDGQMMLHSLTSMRNTPMNQATCQLVGAAMILHRRYDVPLEAMEAYIIRVDDEELDIVPVSGEFMRKIGPCIYRDLLLTARPQARL